MDHLLFLILFFFFAPPLLISARSIPMNLSKAAVVDDQLPRSSSNPIFDCWNCDLNWMNDRQHLADCARGFGKSAIGGKGGEIHMVIDPSDDQLINPKPGTLRHALIQNKPLWIIFPSNMEIKLSGQLYVHSFKTIDGRGANVRISGKSCLMLEDVTNVIIHGVDISDCVPDDSAYIKMNETQVKHAGKTKGNGITIIRSQNIWVDNCTISDCANDLIDATLLSTDLTFSNNLYFNKSELLLDRQDNNGLKKITTVFNRFGKRLTQIPPSRDNGASPSTTSENDHGGTYTSANNFWNKYLAVKVVFGLVFTIVLGSVGYGIYKLQNYCCNGNIFCNCCNGNRIN